MKILLIQPPFTISRSESKRCHPPLGLAYLAAALKFKYEVSILDALAEGFCFQEFIDKEFLRYGLMFKKIRERILAIKPDIVGISCPFSTQIDNVSEICRIAKEISKNIITILGGAHPSALPYQVLRDKNVDFVVIGEGEITLNRLIYEIMHDNKLNDVDGLGYKEDGKIRINQKINYIDNLDSLAFPDWGAFPLETYFRINNPHGSPAKRIPFIPMITSRGCPFDCVFCSIHNIWGRKYRIRSAENVILEFEYLIKNFGIKEILFEDDNLTLDKIRAKQIFMGMLSNKFDITWATPNGVYIHSLDDEMLSLMKRSGCYSISIGIESGDKDILMKLVGKPMELSSIPSLVNKARKLGIQTTSFFVVGLPGETKQQLENTFSFAKRLGTDDTNFFFANPLPGTKLFDICKKEGLIANEEIDCFNLRLDRPIFFNKHVSVEELKSRVNQEKLLLYFCLLFKNPKFFLKKLFFKLSKDPKYFIRYNRRFSND